MRKHMADGILSNSKITPKERRVITGGYHNSCRAIRCEQLDLNCDDEHSRISGQEHAESVRHYTP
jgi:hypothetical protein